MVSPIDCLTGEEVTGLWTVVRFFDILVRADQSHGMLKLKVGRPIFEDASMLMPSVLGLAFGGAFRSSLQLPEQGL